MAGTATAVRDRLNEFASARALTVAAVMPLTQAQLDFSPRPGRWSVGEIADHLMRSEDLYRAEMAHLVELARAGKPAYRRHTFADVNVAPLHLPDAVLSYLEIPFGLLSRVIPDSVRAMVTEFPVLPTRNPDVATPRPNRPADALKAELSASAGRTRAIVDANADLDFETLVSEHPLTGRTNVPQILAFLTRHERRHQGQMEAVRRDPRFPPF